MKDKTIEQLEAYLESKGIHPHFSTDIVSLYVGGPVRDYQILYWEIGSFIMCTYRVEMNSGISTFSLTLVHASFSDCKSINDMIYKVCKEWEQ